MKPIRIFRYAFRMVRHAYRSSIIIMFAKLMSFAKIEQICEYKLLANSKFIFNGNTLNYFFHSYNNFGVTERVIEIPIIKYYLTESEYDHALEIGNVTNHYYDYFRKLLNNKIVIDKFEKGYGVINVDINQYIPNKKHDFIFSVSTFEHMDSDLGRNPDYVKGSSELISVAADNIKYVYENLLQEGGKFVITAPLGYTNEWDETFYSDVFKEFNCESFNKYLFKRIKELVWKQVDIEEGKGASTTAYKKCRNYLSVVELNK